MMRGRTLWIVGAVTLITVVGILVLTAVFIPTANPAFDAALALMQALKQGDDAAAEAYLSADMQAYVTTTCRGGSVSACVRDYTPAEWGGILSTVFRRAIPDDAAWDVLLISTYAEGQGFSGVCIYQRVEPVPGGSERWHITRWSGFISCDEPNAGLSSLRADAGIPNRAP